MDEDEEDDEDEEEEEEDEDEEMAEVRLHGPHAPRFSLPSGNLT